MTPEEAYNKALYANKRLPELESIIKQSTAYSYLYARDILRDRWPEAEQTIQKHAEHAYFYAANVIQGRWSEAEQVIQQDAENAYWYARNVIGERWSEVEPIIAQSKYKSDYISHFFSEPIITKDQCSDFEWKRAGAVGYFAPKRLFERKNSLIDMMINNQDMSQY